MPKQEAYNVLSPIYVLCIHNFVLYAYMYTKRTTERSCYAQFLAGLTLEHVLHHIAIKPCTIPRVHQEQMLV